jgi:hypothetical protein
MDEQYLEEVKMFSHHRRRNYLLLAMGAVLALAVIAIFFAANPNDAEADAGNRLEYQVQARNPRLNREVQGEVTAQVMGVPAEPVDSFVWDGEGSVPVQGTAHLRVDPVANTGVIRAEWKDRNGNWRFEQKAFFAPEHAHGLRVGSSGDETVLEFDDGVPVNVYLHGDTTAGGPVLPTIFNHLATWGPARVWLNGQLFENPYDGPTPLWVAHTMTTVGVRGDDGTVRTVDGEIFNPMQTLAEGATDDSDMEFHLVFHDAAGPATDNFPPPLSFFYHLTFEDVKLDITHAE